MSRTINIADSKGRNAEIVFSSKTKKPLVKLVDANGKDVKTIRILKSTAVNTYEQLLKKFQNPEELVNAVIDSNPEIDLLMSGRFISGTSRVYIDKDLKPVGRVILKEKVFTPDGNLKEERIPKETIANILSDYPVKGAKLFPKKDIYNKFVFLKKYQLSHLNGLTFDFLFEIAKELHEKEVLMMLGAEPKGNEPLVFQDGAKAYRAFLEGRIEDNKYLLIIHLSNLELKPLVL